MRRLNKNLVALLLLCSWLYSDEPCFSEEQIWSSVAMVTAVALSCEQRSLRVLQRRDGRSSVTPRVYHKEDLHLR